MVTHHCNFSSLEEIVQGYILEYQRAAANELRYFAWFGSLEAVVEAAGMAIYPPGKRYNHQRRIPPIVLEEARRRFAGADLRGCTSFGALIELIDRVTADIKGYGELTVYDTALHIGAFLGLLPDRVYLHRGTRVGAKALGLDGRRKTINVEELPEEFRRLKAHEIEDVLCIYEDEIFATRRVTE